MYSKHLGLPWLVRILTAQLMLTMDLLIVLVTLKKNLAEMASRSPGCHGHHRREHEERSLDWKRSRKKGYEAWVRSRDADRGRFA